MPSYRKDRPRLPWRVSTIAADGNRVSRSFRTKPEAMEFELRVVQQRARVRAGLEPITTGETFLEFAGQWLRRRKGLKPQSTTDGEDSKLRLYWGPRLGPKRMNLITGQEVERLLYELKDGGIDPDKPKPISNATFNRHRSLLHTIFRDAQRRGVVQKNPVSDIQTLSEKKKVRKTGFWKSMDEADRYIAAAFAREPVMGVLATVLLFAGPRIDEAIPLTWDDIDLESGSLHVFKTYERVSKSIKERTKGEGEGGFHFYPVFPRVRMVLEQWRETVKPRKPNEQIFLRETGKLLTYNAYYAAHKRVIIAAGVPYIAPHDFRRTCAKNLEKIGFTKSQVQEVLGHASIATTEKYTPRDALHLVELGSRLGFGQVKLPPGGK